MSKTDKTHPYYVQTLHDGVVRHDHMHGPCDAGRLSTAQHMHHTRGLIVRCDVSIGSGKDRDRTQQDALRPKRFRVVKSDGDWENAVKRGRRRGDRMKVKSLIRNPESWDSMTFSIQKYNSWGYPTW